MVSGVNVSVNPSIEVMVTQNDQAPACPLVAEEIKHTFLYHCGGFHGGTPIARGNTIYKWVTTRGTPIGGNLHIYQTKHMTLCYKIVDRSCGTTS